MAKFMPTIQQVSADERGEIFVINLPDDRELILLHSVKGSLRGGHAHDCDEVITVLTGEIHYDKCDQDGSEWTEEVVGGDSRFVPKGLYHLGEFREDSWLVEWKLAKDKWSWRNIDHEPYRSKVSASVGRQTQ